MRMRKKKWADPYLQAHSDFIYEQPENYKGKWKELFNTSDLHVEIGMGKGGYLNQMASMYPESGWVGIEKDRSVAAVAARKVLESENPNLENKRMIAGNAEHLLEWFEQGEVDTIHLNFSDPWPKKHYHKRRLSSDSFLDIYKIILSENGKIVMKTDNSLLFEDSVLYFLKNGFTFTEFYVDYRKKEHPEDAITEYESKFIEEGKPIYKLTAVIVK